MSYVRPKHTTLYHLPKRGRNEYHRVEGFVSKDEAQQYSDWAYDHYWGYGPSFRITQAEDGTWNVNVTMWDSCD